MPNRPPTQRVERVANAIGQPLVDGRNGLGNGNPRSGVVRLGVPQGDVGPAGSDREPGRT